MTSDPFGYFYDKTICCIMPCHDMTYNELVTNPLRDTLSLRFFVPRLNKVEEGGYWITLCLSVRQLPLNNIHRTHCPTKTIFETGDTYSYTYTFFVCFLYKQPFYSDSPIHLSTTPHYLFGKGCAQKRTTPLILCMELTGIATSFYQCLTPTIISLITSFTCLRVYQDFHNYMLWYCKHTLTIY